MTILLSDNIVSALGFTTDENFRRVRDGVSGLTFFDGQETGVSGPFVASAIDGAALDEAFYALPRAAEKRYTRLEKAVILSVADALKGRSIDPSGERVLFILSTTKGNVSLLDTAESEGEGCEPGQVYLWRSAELIAGYFGNPNTPLVVSNACISGACALIAAQRALQAGRYDCVVVAGADMLSRFIIAGFQSFKALSQEICKPFDARRSGLNLGEAAATLILAEKPVEALQAGDVVLTAGAACNDANHISGPSRTGEGAYLALKRVLSGVDTGELAFVNAHGTATPYNDEMEAIAIHRAALQDVPVTSLKGYFGHTLGCAGVLESIVSTRALREGTVLKTVGCDTPGVSQPLRIAGRTQPVKGRRCINMLSGFGGCNAALLYTLKCRE
ncbi:MAG: beta-ketoacyl synthase [Tannerella sp.]|jgi:3-oxoacyl-[acyl-carrier-protein] synthase-1|nr:beta-ketoacyl synthase [Tannerella sp.]